MKAVETERSTAASKSKSEQVLVEFIRPVKASAHRRIDGVPRGGVTESAILN